SILELPGPGSLHWRRVKTEIASMANTTAKRRQPTVLMVEDDDVIRDALTYLLVSEGYLVLGARSGHDAIGVVKAPLSPIDVAVLDINLPDVSGVDLCARIRELHPHLPVIVCTGESDAAV